MEASIYRLRTRDLLALCVLSLLLMGVLMVQSASTRLTDAPLSTLAAPAVDPTGNSGWGTNWDFAGPLKHVILVGVALTAFFVVGYFDYRKLARVTTLSFKNPLVWFYCITCALCLLTLVPGIGKTVNGARRWIGAGPLQVQPSELAKWAVVLVLAWALAYHEEVRKRFGKFLLLCLAVAVPCLLVVIQDFGTAALIGLTAILLMLAGRVKTWHLATVLPPILAVGFWFVRHREYRWRRMTSFLDPFADPQGEGYHMVQSLLSFSSGGIFGRGLGNGIQKLGYLPEDTTDFIFAVICEELGLFGALLTILFYLGIAFVAWQVLRGRSGRADDALADSLGGQLDGPTARDPFAHLLVFGVATIVCTQAIINIAVATVSVPTKGLSLPLVSAGGSGLVITAAALGLIYSVARRQEQDRAPEELPLLPAVPA